MHTAQSPTVLGAGAGIAVAAIGLLLLPLSATLFVIAAAAGLGAVVATLSSPREYRTEARHAIATAAVLAALGGTGTAAYAALGTGAPLVVAVFAGLVLGTQTAVGVLAVAAPATLLTVVAKRLTAETVRTALTSPAFVGSMVGLVGGCVAIAVAAALFETPYALLAGMSGAVFGGVTAGALADPAFEPALIHAGVADLLSSAYVFVGFLPALTVVQAEPVWLLTVPYYVPLGAIVAIPVGAVSLLVATTAGTLTFLGKRAAGPT